jgi:2-C-methyl-D-erythritol 4-phosphate cytidylyltransferase
MVSAVIVAAGRGRRMNCGIRKQYLRVAGRPLVIHTLSQFDACPLIDRICLVVPEDGVEESRRSVAAARLETPLQIVAGGRERQESVRKGLEALEQRDGLVAIHDGVRPLVAQGLITACIQAAEKAGACAPGIPVCDTIKRVSGEGLVTGTLERRGLWLIQTPQVFRYAIIADAHASARRDGFHGTDDAALVERLGYPVKLITGSKANIKVTTPEDLAAVAAWLKATSA